MQKVSESTWRRLVRQPILTVVRNNAPAQTHIPTYPPYNTCVYASRQIRMKQTSMHLHMRTHLHSIKQNICIHTLAVQNHVACGTMRLCRRPAANTWVCAKHVVNMRKTDQRPSTKKNKKTKFFVNGIWVEFITFCGRFCARALWLRGPPEQSACGQNATMSET